MRGEKDENTNKQKILLKQKVTQLTSLHAMVLKTAGVWSVSKVNINILHIYCQHHCVSNPSTIVLGLEAD